MTKESGVIGRNLEFSFFRFCQYQDVHPDERTYRDKRAVSILVCLGLCLLGSLCMFPFVGGDRGPTDVWIRNESNHTIYVQERVTDDNRKFKDNGDKIEIKPGQTSNGGLNPKVVHWFVRGYGRKQIFEIWTENRSTGIVFDPSLSEAKDFKIVLTYPPK